MHLRREIVNRLGFTPPPSCFSSTWMSIERLAMQQLIRKSRDKHICVYRCISKLLCIDRSSEICCTISPKLSTRDTPVSLPATSGSARTVATATACIAATHEPLLAPWLIQKFSQSHKLRFLLSSSSINSHQARGATR